MEKKEIIDIEIEIATTGETFICNAVSIFCTAKELLVAFLCYAGYDSKYQDSWELVHKAQVIDKSKKIFELIDEEKDEIKLTLVAMVKGAGA